MVSICTRLTGQFASFLSRHFYFYELLKSTHFRKNLPTNRKSPLKSSTGLVRFFFCNRFTHLIGNCADSQLLPIWRSSADSFSTTNNSTLKQSPAVAKNCMSSVLKRFNPLTHCTFDVSNMAAVTWPTLYLAAVDVKCDNRAAFTGPFGFQFPCNIYQTFPSWWFNACDFYHFWQSVRYC